MVKCFSCKETIKRCVKQAEAKLAVAAVCKRSKQKHSNPRIKYLQQGSFKVVLILVVGARIWETEKCTS